MALGRSLVATATLLAVCQGVQLRPQGNTTEQEAETVCISIAAFEEAEWVDLLIANALRFAEPDTRVVVHLDNGTQYEEADVQRWRTQNPRVAVTDERVYVRPFMGSVLWSHMLNAQTMAKTWGGTCKYFVLQASNMMWVRQGMEQSVRERQFSPLGGHPGGGGCAYVGRPEWVNFSMWEGFSKLMVAQKHMYGHGQPEGSFFPLRHVLGFKRMLDGYIARDLHGDWFPICYAKCYFENTWLQTYMLNFVELPEFHVYQATGMTALSRNAINNKLGKLHDSCPMEELEAVQRGAEGHEYHYAVKRVNRNMTHPITQLIHKMSHDLLH